MPHRTAKRAHTEHLEAITILAQQILGWAEDAAHMTPDPTWADVGDAATAEDGLTAILRQLEDNDDQDATQ